jgi:hypothetical protein
MKRSAPAIHAMFSCHLVQGRTVQKQMIVAVDEQDARFQLSMTHPDWTIDNISNLYKTYYPA